ncbi:hypothetical protein D3C86_1421610 [compost metagenome]
MARAQQLDLERQHRFDIVQCHIGRVGAQRRVLVEHGQAKPRIDQRQRQRVGLHFQRGVRLQCVARQRLAHQQAQRGVVVVADEGAVHQLVHRHRPAPPSARQRQRARHGQQHPPGGHGLRGDGLVPGRREGEAHVDLVGQQRVHDLVGMVGQHLDLGFRVPRAEAPHRRHQQRIGQARRGRHAQPAGALVAQALGHAPHALDLPI